MQAPNQCVVLIGGLGSRLGVLTAETPKPLLSVAGRPFLSYLLWNLRRHGFRRVLLLAGYRADKVRDYVEQLAPDPSFEVRCLVEPEPRGTAGALAFAAEEVDDWFVLLNGDTIFDFNILDLHRSAASRPDVDVHMALRRLSDASRFGVVEMKGDHVTGFSAQGSSQGGVINAGVYQISKRILHRLPPSGSLEHDVLPQLAGEGRVCGRAHSGFFIDIGVPQSLAEAQTSVPAFMKRPAVFFDRDGVLNVDHGHVGERERLEWIGGAAEAVRRVNDRGWFAFLVTNQSGVARGLYSVQDVDALHGHMQNTLRSEGAHLDDIRLCPFHPDGVIERYRRASDWRKPEPGMILDLMQHWPIDRTASWIVGDNETDIDAGRAAGVANGFLFRGNDLNVAIDQVLGIEA